MVRNSNSEYGGRKIVMDAERIWKMAEILRDIRGFEEKKLNVVGVSKFGTENVALKWKLEEQPN